MRSAFRSLRSERSGAKRLRNVSAVLSALVLLGGWARTCAAAEAYFAPLPTWRGPAIETPCVALGDVDGDGKLDLVCGNVAGGTRLYLNTGGTFAVAPAWTGPDEGTWSVALGDVNGDGELDLVCGNLAGGATLYLNTGGTFAAAPAWTSAGPLCPVALGDVDGDGNLDLCGVGDGGVELYPNISGTFASAPAWTGPAEATFSVALGDVDGDGRLDLVCGNSWSPYYGEISAVGKTPDLNGATLYLNTGGTFAHAPTWAEAEFDAIDGQASVALGDVDGDGKLDLVFAELYGDPKLFLNIGGTFAGAAAWTGPSEASLSVALADVDGDGDMDLLLGGYPDVNRGNNGAVLYLNTCGTFAAGPDWTGPVEYTRSVVLGDVDGDGDLDLVRGNWQGGSTLYLNTGGTFAPAPAWSGPAEATISVALGDVNGDGYPDLVCGNDDAGSTLYLNNGGTFALTPAWTGPREFTSSVALGDVDGDGDLDLVRGNWQGGSTLYLNTGGTFAPTAAWTGPDEYTFSVALGDVNGDGRLDLVCGNHNQGSTFYLNTGGTFAPAAGWTGPQEYTESVALGDVDGDGRLDLVRGNTSGGSTLYLNTGGTFAPTAAWTGPDESTYSVALGDVNGDGRLDLVCGNIGNSTLYLNTGGTFAAAPAWSGPYESIVSVALGDVDGDGDLDLVRGDGDHQSATIHLRKSPWHLAAGAPAQQLPNNPAYLRSLFAVMSGDNLCRISVTAFDVEADPVWIIGEYEFEGTASWQPMQLDGSPLRSGPFTTSAAGVSHTIDWDVTTVPFDRRNVAVRLRAVSPPRRAGVIQFQPSYVATLGRITPTRPALSSSPSGIAFGTLTVGDSSAVTLQLSNPGNLDLVIEGIDSPGPEVQVAESAGLVLPPGQTRTVAVTLAPRVTLATLAPLVVRSNDPLRPAVEVPLTADIRGLTYQSQLIAASPQLPLGEAVTVIVTPAAQVHLERGFLFYRARGTSTFADSVAIAPQGSNFVALVPGRSVTEAGLEYYLRLENSGVFAVDPPGAPATSFFQPVTAPAGIISVAQPDGAGDFPTARATPVNVSLPLGSSFESGALHYRLAGAAQYDSTSLDSIEVAPGVFALTAAIPATSVGPRGLEYWASVSTVSTLAHPLTDPAVDPASHPHIVRTTVASLKETATHAGGHYRMITVPLELLNLPPASSLEDLVGGQPEFGPYDPARWRSFRWQPASSAYLEISPANTASGALRPEPGRAFWLNARNANRIDTAPVAGRSTVATPITLEPGWNQVGNPYAYAVAWSGVSASDASGPVTLEPPVAWDEAAGRYATTDVTVLEPFAGYWIHNATTGPVALNIPPIEVVATPMAAASQVSTDSLAWSVQITASCGVASDSRNFAGVMPLALEGADALDRAEAPLAPGEALSLYFVGSEPGVRRSFDLRPAFNAAAAAGDPAAHGRRWTFDVARAGVQLQPVEASLTFAGLERVPAEVELRLVDRTLGRAIDLRQEGTYRYVTGARGFVAGETAARFELIAGTRVYVEAARSGLTGPPARTQLLAPYPNPLAGTSVVRFELARAGRVSVEVFDFAGRRVRTLAEGSRTAGRFELLWSGDDDLGRRLPQGVYLLRLAGPDRADTRKVVLVR